MSETTMHIDPEKFAYHFMDSLEKIPQPETGDIERSAKVRLAAYLSSYFLIERFNHQEAKNFNNNQPEKTIERGFEDMSFTEILKKVAEINEKASDNLKF